MEALRGESITGALAFLRPKRFPCLLSGAKRPFRIALACVRRQRVSNRSLKMAATGSVALTFPDGARREYPKGITGFDVAKAISPSLAKRPVPMALDGAPAGLARPIPHDAKIAFLNPAHHPSLA